MIVGRPRAFGIDPKVPLEESAPTGGIADETVLTGDAEASEPVSGDISVKGEDGSGLRIKTSVKDGAETMSVDIAGRETKDKFSIREVKDDDGNVVSKVLATEGFVLPTSDTTVDVLTGVDSVEVDMTGDEPKVTIKFTKKTLTVVKFEDAADTADAEIPLEKYEVVESSEYSGETGKFTNKLAALAVLGHTSPQASEDPVVFEAVAHSDNT